jgi:glycosyltransferase involved in cell wall biosynthesis
VKIALVSTTCLRVPPRTYGGTELVIAELADGLVARGHEVTLYATADSETSATLRALYPEPRWPPDFSADLNHISWALEWVRREGADVVHVHSAPALAFARLLGGIPMVYTIHHVRDEQLSSFYAHFDEPWYVAISADQAAKEVPLRRRAVIHHGLDPRRFECVAVPGDYVCFIMWGASATRRNVRSSGTRGRSSRRSSGTSRSGSPSSKRCSPVARSSPFLAAASRSWSRRG